MLADLLIENGYVLTMDPRRRLIDGGTVAIKDGRILAVGTTAELTGRFTAPKIIDAGRMAVLPGLIDTHGHGGHSLMKTVGEHLPGGSWRTLMDHVYFRSTGPEFWYADGLLNALERLKFGTTLGMSILGSAPRTDRPEPAERFADGLAAVGIRGIIGVGPARPPWPRKYSWWEDGKKQEYTSTLEGNIETTRALIRNRHSSAGGKVMIWVSASRFSAPSKFDPVFKPEFVPVAYTQARLMKEVAQEFGVGIHTHAYGGAVAFAHKEFGIMGPNVNLAHCQGLSEEEIQIFADTGASVSYSPSARRNYAYKARCPVPELLDAGVTVAISTDGTAPDVTFDLFKDMRNAMTAQRLALTDKYILPPGKALEMITIDAAKSLRLDRELGSLEVGKQADVTLVNLAAPHLTPRFMVPHRLVHEASGHDVDTVIVAGKVLMEGRRVLTVDESKVMALAQQEAERAIRRAGVTPLMQMNDRFWGSSRY